MLISSCCGTSEHSVSFSKACNFKVGVTWIFEIFNIIGERFFSIFRKTKRRDIKYFSVSRGAETPLELYFALEITRAMISIVATKSCERPPRDRTGIHFGARACGLRGLRTSLSRLSALILPDTQGAFLSKYRYSSTGTFDHWIAAIVVREDTHVKTPC